jgi:hypothetical protein
MMRRCRFGYKEETKNKLFSTLGVDSASCLPFALRIRSSSSMVSSVSPSIDGCELEYKVRSLCGGERKKRE